jgi:hypothetical protein
MPIDDIGPNSLSESFIVRHPDGSTEGRHPDDLAPEVLGRAHQKRSIMAVIRAKCLDCCCHQQSEVRRCTAVHCPLWPYRMGTNPFHGARGKEVAPGAFIRKTPVKDGEIEPRRRS